MGFATGTPLPTAGSGRPGSKVKSTTTRPGRCLTSLRCSTGGTATTRNVDRLHRPPLRPQHRLSRHRQRRHGDLRVLEDRLCCQAPRPPVPRTRARVSRTVVRATAPRAARCIEDDRRPRSQLRLSPEVDPTRDVRRHPTHRRTPVQRQSGAPRTGAARGRERRRHRSDVSRPRGVACGR